MANKVILSTQFTLQARDFLKGLLVAVLTSVAVVVQEVIQTGSLKFNWEQIGTVALGSAIAYLAKNFFAAPSVITTYASNDKAAEVAEDIKK